MEDRNLEQAMQIVARLLDGEEISRSGKKNIALYEEYAANAEVYDIVRQMLKHMNLKLYEYQYGLYLTAGENNRIFGFSNEELKRALGVKLNKELYLCYFIMYQTICFFYKDTASPNFVEYIRIEDAIRSVDIGLNSILEDLEVLVEGETEEESFKALSLLWSELPLVTGEDGNVVRAAKNSKRGYVKLTFNFLVSQRLLMEEKERYYPKDRFRALIENYFEEYQGRLYELLQTPEEGRGEEKEDAAY